jgi:hypothetical protein
MPVDRWPGRPEGYGWRSGDGAGLCRSEGVQSAGDRACLWITGLAGLRGAAWQSSDRVGLCRPEGCSLVEQRLCRPVQD